MSDPRKSNPTFIIVIAALVIAALIGFVMVSAPAPEQVAVEETVTPPTGGIETGGIELGAAPYSLSGTNEETITEKSFPDKYKLVYFGFTRCPDVCPVGMANVTAAMTALGADADKIQPVFITVDPEYDTLQIIKDYLYNYDKRFVGATGTAEQLKAAQDSFRVYASQAEPPKAVEATVEPQTQPAPPEDAHAAHGDAHDHAATGGGMINHSDYIYFMGKDGKLLNVYPGNTDGQTLASNVQTVLAAELIPSTPLTAAPVEAAAPAPADTTVPAETAPTAPAE